MTEYIKVFKGIPEVKKGKYRTDVEWEIQGRKTLKRRLLGFCGRRATKSIDEVVAVLKDLGACETAEEGKKVLDGIYGVNVAYSPVSAIRLTKVRDSTGREAIRIEKTESDFFREIKYRLETEE